ncbi:MAG: hypothetical protein DRZ76_01245 [Candidatus Nealsonbacteria bacterium]|nr:MAG: hypothetical protein DRZ76_01245 [Candidatus Nealsonbacteria bacterium]
MNHELENNTNKLVSVIIPAYNEKKLIEKALLSLKRQSYKPIEIIVVYRGNDQTAEIAKKYTERVFLAKEKGASRARNLGAKKARGQYLVFLDADSELSKNTIQNVVSFLDQGYAGGTAKIVYKSKDYKIKGAEILQNFCLNRWGVCLCPFIYTTKEIFEKSGGWPESIEFGEDMNFLKRLSRFGGLKYDHNSQVLTSPRRFIRKKDYFYAILGGVLVLGGVKNLPFYAIRDVEEIKRKEPKIKSLFNKRISLPPKTQRFFLSMIDKKRFRKFFENYKNVLKVWQQHIEVKRRKTRIPLIIWGVTKTIFLSLWILAGFWIWQKTGIWGIIPFGIMFFFFQITDFWNQFLINKAVKSLEAIAKEKTSLKDKNLISEKIWQLETKRSLFTAIFYLLKRTGLNKIPKYSPQKELADIGPLWIGKHVGLMLSLLYRILYYFFYGHYWLSQTRFKGKTPKNLPTWALLKSPIMKEFQEKGVFLGADIGCGDGQVIKMLALYCKKKSWPVVFFGIDTQSDIIETALQKLQKNKLTVFKHTEGRVDIDKLINLTKKGGEPVIYLINTRFEKISQLFQPNSLDLIFLINSKHHLEEAWNDGGQKAIEKISKHWLVLDEKRCWTPFILVYTVGWFISRILICEAEDSLLSMHTPEEWASQNIKTIETFPALIWAMSDSLYNLLKQEGTK